MGKSLRLAGWWLLGGLLFGGASATGVLLVKEVEYRYFPTISNVKVTSQTEGDSLLLWGTFNKDRDCRFVEATATAGALALDLEFLDVRPHRSATRTLGPQTFGPWRVTPNLKPLTITVRHSCHSLWFSSSTMIENYIP